MMMKKMKLKLYLIVCLFLCLGDLAASQKQTYIVRVSEFHIPAVFSAKTWYQSLLKRVAASEEVRNIIYTYSIILKGFATRLTENEAELLRRLPGVLSVLPETVFQLQTTRTPLFLGLNPATGILPDSKEGDGIIIGVLDSGVWPESRYYNDAGLGAVPAKWKGECTAATNFNSTNCNKKLIGAQFFSAGYEAALGPVKSRSPRDDNGHGTHTSSTAGGARVPGASFFGYATGTATGMAARARIAAYKVCWASGCYSSDILSAMEKAVGDGVDVLSLSLGGQTTDFFLDPIAIGAFAAVQRGLFVSCAGGNDGPLPSTVSNVAPWIMTVGAGTIDRDFPAYAVLGNGKSYSGVSLYNGIPLPATAVLPLIYARNASNPMSGSLCLNGSLIPEKVSGKIVLCDPGVNRGSEKGAVVKAAGGVGMILANAAIYGEELIPGPGILPTITVGQKNGDEIRRYATSFLNPKATIIIGKTRVDVQPSPVVAAFSSRGPNPVVPVILKPDVIAPGVNILAGWTQARGPTELASDARRVDFNIVSGTSMACPHVSGLAALLKGAHPDWSPAAIKSALMTTAYAAYKNGSPLLDSTTWAPSTPFVHGAGHVNPQKAVDPGLVYDITPDDYLLFLCSLGYTPTQIAVVAGGRVINCTGVAAGSLNYPSFVVPFAAGIADETIVVRRRVTNVGAGNSSYSVLVSSPEIVKTVVEPQELNFTQKGQMGSYTVSFSSTSLPSGTAEFGFLEWSDGRHRVRSPIVFTWM
ncbi:Subtilisin-like protease SBT1-8 [Nymphaea thermarum]|nr:Subtilisin-like protease SBT1-8 [Nymphaea thermarum]